MTMTLDDVLDGIRGWIRGTHLPQAAEWADAIDAHLTASQPAQDGVDAIRSRIEKAAQEIINGSDVWLATHLAARDVKALASAPPAGVVVDDIAAEGSPTNRWLFKRMCSAVGIDIGSDTVSEAWLKFAKVLRAAATATKGAEG